MTTQDLQTRIDLTALTEVTASELMQLVNAAKPADDKGLQIVTVDTALNTPEVPNPSVELESITPTYWTNYLWKREPHASDAAGVVKTYQWNPNATSDATYLKWELITADATQALADAAAALATAEEADETANTALTNSEAAVNTANDASAVVTTQNARISALETYVGDSLTGIVRFQGTNNGSTATTYKMVLSPTPVDLSLYAGLKVSFVAPVTCGETPRLTIYETTTTAIGSIETIVKYTGGTSEALQAGDIVAGQVVEVVFDGNDWQIISPLAATNKASGVITNNTKGLILKRPSTSTIDVDANEVVVSNASSVLTLSAVDLTISTGATGANGTEVAVAADSWYYIFVIYDPTNELVAGFMAETTSPTLPSGYTMSAMVGAVHRTGTNLVDFQQYGTKVWITAGTVFTAKARAVTNTYEALTAGEITDFKLHIPPIAKTWQGILGHIALAVGDYGFGMAVAATSGGLGVQSHTTLANTGGSNIDNFGTSFTVSCPILDYDNPLYWKTLQADASAYHRLVVIGYEL